MTLELGLIGALFIYIWGVFFAFLGVMVLSAIKIVKEVLSDGNISR